MKKIFIAIIATFVLTGCSFSFGTKTDTFILDEGEFVSEITLEHSMNIVKKETIVNTITFETKSDMRLMEDYIESYEDLYKDVDGLTHEVEYGNKKIVETLVIDFEELDFGATEALEKLGLDKELESGVGFKETEELLLDEGYEKVE